MARTAGSSTGCAYRTTESRTSTWWAHVVRNHCAPRPWTRTRDTYNRHRGPRILQHRARGEAGITSCDVDRRRNRWMNNRGSSGSRSCLAYSIPRWRYRDITRFWIRCRTDLPHLTLRPVPLPSRHETRSDLGDSPHYCHHRDMLTWKVDLECQKICDGE